MRRSVLVTGAVLWTLAFLAGGWLFSSMKAAAVPAQAGPVIEMRVPEGWEPPKVEGFSLVDQTGATVTAETLAGKPYVANFIFTRCPTHCPDMLGKMVELDQSLEGVDVRLVTITVDPENDTPERMAEYADIFTTDPDRWKFLTGDPEELLKVVQYGHRNLLPDPPTVEKDLGPQAAHSLSLMHVGADGQVKGSYHYRDARDLSRLERVLRGKAETNDENKVRPPVDQLIAIEIDPETGEETIISPAAEGTDLKLDAAPQGTTDAPGTSDAEAEPAEVVATTETGDIETSDVAGDPLANLPSWAKRLPLVNASLNGLATLLLLGGFAAIKRNNAHLHRNLMVTTVLVSGAFLACYLVYHWALGAYTDSHGRPFTGSGAAAGAYYTILITHVLLAVAVPFLVAIALWRAYTKQWNAHKRIARITFPIWLYVSVTGVVIYAMLYHWPA